MISAAKFYGGAHAQTLTSSIAPLHPGGARLYQFRTSGSNEVELANPSAIPSLLRAGTPVIVVVNQSNAPTPPAVNDVVVKDHTGATLVTLAAGEACEFDLAWTGAYAQDPSGSFAWVHRMRTVL